MGAPVLAQLRGSVAENEESHQSLHQHKRNLFQNGRAFPDYFIIERLNFEPGLQEGESVSSFLAGVLGIGDWAYDRDRIQNVRHDRIQRPDLIPLTWILRYSSECNDCYHLLEGESRRPLVGTPGSEWRLQLGTPDASDSHVTYSDVWRIQRDGDTMQLFLRADKEYALRYSYPTYYIPQLEATDAPSSDPPARWSGLDAYGAVAPEGLLELPTGSLDLYRGDDISGGVVCIIPVYNGFVNFQNDGYGCDNDEVRSVKWVNVDPRCRITIYDGPDGWSGDGYVVMTPKDEMAPLSEFAIGSLERSQSDGPVEVAYRRKNGLNGKVSAVRIECGN